MAAFNWRKWVGSKFEGFTGGARKSKAAAVRRGALTLESLEDRLAPANFVVTTNADSGAGSLRDAVNQANNEQTNPGLDHISFDPSMAGKTINLTTLAYGGYFVSHLLITSPITITGLPTHPGVSVAGGAVYRIFYVSDGAELTLENLTVSGGVARGGDGYGAGEGEGGRGGGGAGLGGAILNQGIVRLNGDTFRNNSALGGAGGARWTNSIGGGGGGVDGPGEKENGGGPNGGVGFWESSIDDTPQYNGNPGDVGGGGGGGHYATQNEEPGSGGNGGFGGGGGAGASGYDAGQHADQIVTTGGAGGGWGGFGGGGGGGGASTYRDRSPGGGGAGGFGEGNGTDGYDSVPGPAYGGEPGFGGGGAGMGGALFNHGGFVVINDCTFTGNHAQGGASSAQPGSGLGGALFNLNGAVIITNSTFSGNSADDGGSIYTMADNSVPVGPGENGQHDAALLMDNTIAANTPNGVADITNNATRGTSVAGGDSDLVGNSNEDRFRSQPLYGRLPLLGSLQDNGGPTWTMAPLLISGPTVNTGTDSPSVSSNTDQRGIRRIHGSHMDIGAVELNQAPFFFTPSSDWSVAEHAALTFTAVASDFDADPLTYSLVNGPSGATIDPSTGKFTWTPSEAQGPGTFTFEIRASDGDAFADHTVTVAVTEVNDFAPVLVSYPTTEVQASEFSPVTFTVAATDDDVPESLTYSLVNAPAGASINPTTGNFTWTPSEAQGPDYYTISIRVTDGGSPSKSATQGVIVNVREVNSAPQLDPIADQTVAEGNSVSLTASATDSDLPANKLTYSLVNAPAGASINPTTGEFTWTPTGDATVTVRVTDNGTPALHAAQSFRVTVLNVPPTPIVTGGPTLASEGKSVTYTGSFTDPGGTAGGPYSYTWKFTSNNGQTGTVSSTVASPGGVKDFSFTPNDNGDYRITLQVTDRYGASTTTADYRLSVANADPTPSIGGVPAGSPEGTAISLTGSATDPGSADTTAGFTYAWSVTKDGSPYAAGSGANVGFTPDDDASYAVTLKATDKDGGFDVTSKTITVTNVAPTPTLTGPGGGLVTQPLGYKVAATDPSVVDQAAGFVYTIDWNDGTPVQTVGRTPSNGSGVPVSHVFTAAGDYTVRLTATDADGGASTLTQTITMQAMTAANLQTTLAQQGSVATQAATNAEAQSVVSAVNALPPQTTPVTVTLNLGAGTYSGMTANPPAGVTLVLVGTGGTTTIAGNSPAMQLTGGNVTVRDVTLVNSTNAPTLLVGGGNLVLRNVVVQESTGANQVAVSVTGGTVDLGTASDPGGNRFNVNGSGLLIRNTGAGTVSAIGNTFQVDSVTLASPYRIEDKIFHALDSGGGGLVSYVANNVYVTGSTGSIQRGVDAVPAGGTVNVEAGSYQNYDVGSRLLTVRFENGLTLSQQSNPQDASLLDVVVTGTAGNDQIQFTPGGGFQVQVNGLPNGRFSPTGRIVAYGLGGNDVIQVAGGVGLPAWLFGGAGNDTLQGGGGDSVLVGGEGNDTLQAGLGRALLIGGSGADQLQGSSGDDLLIAGATVFDFDQAALAAVMAEWTSARSYAERLANLRGTGCGPRANGNVFLKVGGPDVTVYDDSAADVLQGGSGTDWFFANRSGGVALDVLTGLAGSEIVDELGVPAP